MYYPMYVDPTYILIIIGVLLSLAASTKVKSTFGRYSQVRSLSGLTGAQTAERILRQAGIYDVGIARVSGDLTDHYDPSSKTLRLSDSVYGSTSVAAVSVAAHECGHAINIGIWMFVAVVAFHLVTLPVEFNASSRALKIMESSGILHGDENRYAKEVLGAAALTYVAGAASMILQLLRLLILTGAFRRNDDER